MHPKRDVVVSTLLQVVFGQPSDTVQGMFYEMQYLIKVAPS